MSAQHDMDIITLYVCIYISFSDITTWAYDHIHFYSCNQIASCQLRTNLSKMQFAVYEKYYFMIKKRNLIR